MVILGFCRISVTWLWIKEAKYLTARLSHVSIFLKILTKLWTTLGTNIVLDQGFFIDVRFLTALGDIQIFKIQYSEACERETCLVLWQTSEALRKRGTLRNDILKPVDNVLEAEHENVNQDEVMGNEEQIEVMIIVRERKKFYVTKILTMILWLLTFC